MSAKKMFYSMGEVSEMFDVNPSLIRHWESKFDCLRPHKNKKGNRLFSPSDVEKLKQIYHLVKERGMTLEGANKAMKSSRGVLSRDTELLERLQRIRAALVEVREELRDGVQDDIVEEAYSVADTVEAPLASDVAVDVERADKQDAVTDTASAETESVDAEHAEPESADEDSVAVAEQEAPDDPAAVADAEVVASPDPEVSEAAAAGESEPVRPSVAAVSPKSRTRRRKKGDDEEKELFPFYEQSLF
ncbi:MAG: MerR family transcriptional regulator [Bacteroidales bacterium]|nr:MAG: MerR family transcriptional regulator [Bacteroidales bacterium]